MDEKICEMRHQRLDEKIEVHDKRINNHSERLDVIERVNGRLEERLDGLIKQLSVLNSTMKWFMGLLLGGIVSFFFYAIQQGILK
ncbi:hemolysin XhlA family protein [Tissierella pigra]|uniref:hemolysin XhlA family protein n=1 Tax=Tissierella pigra TaxID=2607614 RepID=UPI001C11EFE3|nr:hemolysin XhlA family protein [Tissierella pigra]MBU5425025.1 hemolysin XhlA family protein [Tissierella pigra]